MKQQNYEVEVEEDDNENDDDENEEKGKEGWGEKKENDDEVLFADWNFYWSNAVCLILNSF